MTLLTKSLPAVFALTLLAGCASNAPKDAPTLPVASTFSLHSINGVNALDNSFASISFEKDHRAYGIASCNNFLAHYQLENHYIIFSSVGTTRKMCSAELMQQEQLFIKALEQSKTWKYSPEHGTLSINFGDNESIVFTQNK